MRTGLSSAWVLLSFPSSFFSHLSALDLPLVSVSCRNCEESPRGCPGALASKWRADNAVVSSRGMGHGLGQRSGERRSLDDKERAVCDPVCFTLDRHHPRGTRTGLLSTRDRKEAVCWRVARWISTVSTTVAVALADRAVLSVPEPLSCSNSALV